jgi:uncharacterized protein (UPF0261 family)
MAARDPYILVLGCFDTKGELFSFLCKRILSQGERVVTINTGVMGTTSLFPVDYESDKVALAGGAEITDLRGRRDRGYAVEIMGKGAARIVAGLLEAGGMKAAIGMGGGGGTYIALSAMQPIPLGVPKLCLTTIAAKDVSRQMGNKDITLMPSIVDLSGLNSISHVLISQAAAAICAMANVGISSNVFGTKRVAISMFGNTTPCVEKCRQLLQDQGYEVFAFHATGVGGKTMESLISEGYFDAVLDITTTELADELCGGILSAGPDRLNAAARKGIPQVVVPGCLDMVNFAQMDTVPKQYQARQLYSWAPDVTLMRTNEEENITLGETLARKVSRSTAPATILLPLKGISQIDSAGGIFYQPETDQVLFTAIKKHTASHVPVIEVEAHINDVEFSEKAVQTLLSLMQKQQQTVDKS